MNLALERGFFYFISLVGKRADVTPESEWLHSVKQERKKAKREADTVAKFDLLYHAGPVKLYDIF